MDKRTYLRWTGEEWMAVLAIALPLIDGGTQKIDALLKAQYEALPKPRRRTREGMLKVTAPSSAAYATAVERFGALTPKQRAALLPTSDAPAGEPAQSTTKTPPPDSAGARWTGRERALMAAGVNLLRKEPGHESLPLHTLYIKAQGMILPADRQRSEAGIKQAGYSKERLLQKQHDEGVQDAWKYPETSNPFRAAPAPEVVSAAAAAPVEVPAAVAPASTLGDAAVLFGTTMMTALDALLKTRDTQLAQTVTEQVARLTAEQTESLVERMGQTVQDLLQVQITHIASQVTQGLRTVLLDVVGGPATTPATPPAAEVPPTPPAAQTNGATAPKGLRVDVLGTMPSEWMQRIRDAASPNDEVRFVDFGSANIFAPHRGRHLIVMAQGKMPRALQKKCEAAGVTPISVRDGGGHVLRVLQDLKGGAAGATLQ